LFFADVDQATIVPLHIILNVNAGTSARPTFYDGVEVFQPAGIYARDCGLSNTHHPRPHRFNMRP